MTYQESTPRTTHAIGVIGGSGVYNIDGLTGQHWKMLESPFGTPSDALLFGEINYQPVVFLPRHGRGHRIAPSDINYRANIDVLKRAGVTEIISVSAVGSLREDLTPGTFVIVDQFIDRTFAREKSFFGSGCVAHVSMAHPVCGQLSKHLADAARDADIKVHEGGTYLVMEGPQFSSLAESRLYRSWGCDVIGMTNMPEAKLAREAEIPYASVAMVTDFDCWHPNHDAVTVDQIISVLTENAENARILIQGTLPRIISDPTRMSWPERYALDNAIITAPEARDAAVINQLEAVAGRVLKQTPNP